ncbi:S-layer homology domain-containing protein, partial [Virgibacillus sp. DJP39]|uniref:S-layer homology domain-containing protein n=1 Tax=Virgibacillus sp. DJP39 TaxID=3409790 RepID=UPI003BB7F51F
YLYEHEIVKGQTSDSFGVSAKIKRADAALILARAKNLDTENVPESPLFPDVVESAYYYGAVQAAAKAGYINGYPNGKFDPDGTLTREEMAKIVSVAFELEEVSDNYFYDISNSWAKSYINRIAAKGISVGEGNGDFNPESDITRAEFSVMTARALNDEFKMTPVKTIHIVTLSGDDYVEGKYPVHWTYDLDEIDRYVNSHINAEEIRSAFSKMSSDSIRGIEAHHYPTSEQWTAIEKDIEVKITTLTSLDIDNSEFEHAISLYVSFLQKAKENTDHMRYLAVVRGIETVSKEINEIN